MQTPELKYLSAIRFNGVDAGSFLHSQLSADVLALDAGESTFACYCEPKGRVLALMLVHRLGGDYLVIMSNKLASAVIERLKIYRMRSKVEFETLHGHRVTGIRNTAPEAETDGSYTVGIPGSMDQFKVTPAEVDQGTGTDSQIDWVLEELSRGITWLNPQTSGEFLPQMLGFEQLGAVNYRKGCYPGQEIVARTHYLGKVKRHPRLLKCGLMHCPEPMDKVKILDDEQAYDAVIADCSAGSDGTVTLLAITRMQPDLTARQIEYNDVMSSVL